MYELRWVYEAFVWDVSFISVCENDMREGASAWWCLKYEVLFGLFMVCIEGVVPSPREQAVKGRR